MEKLELKHLAPYLPYGLKVKDIKYGILFEALSFITSPNQSFDVYNCNLDQLIKDGLLKPILRPLSDLTKEIEHNGENFVPIDYFEIGDDNNQTYEYDNGNIRLIQDLEYLSANRLSLDIVFIPYGVIQKLIEWHFDIFGLIEKCLAVDINTLSE